MTVEQTKGSIVLVGPGIMLGAHLTPRTRYYIETADIVFSCCSALVELWLKELNPNLHSFDGLYAKGKHRRDTYNEMVEAMIGAVRDGKKVVSVFYGHPGVFAWAPHKVIALAREEGYAAHMEPGISAADCLYADMGIDPGRVGSQHFETSQLMFYQRRIDPAAYLFLWQPAIAGDLSISRFHTPGAYRQLLVELLLEQYPADHQVALYEAAFLATETKRIEWLKLSDLPKARMTLTTTLVIPPAVKLQRNEQMLAKLAALDEQLALSSKQEVVNA